ncbi:VirB4 family type IV secretion system protein [Pseudonocardia sp. CA-107938]|uniref:VirB4 family type IV secretion system protein n=1 Tax=Pseudonocardia sp. CA-107938 TaxID=3240021 RepID=UPI003D90E97B
MGARHLVIDGEHVAVFAVTGYPAEVAPGWLEPLLTYPGRLDVSMHVEPIDSATAATRLRRQLARLESGRRHDDDHGRLPDPHVEAAVEDAHELASRVARGEAHLFRVGLTLAVYAPDERALADEVAAVRPLVSSLLLDARPASYRQLAGWTTCLPVGIDALRVHRIMDTDAIAAAFPFTSPDLPSANPAETAAPDGVMLGLNLQSSGPVIWDRFAAENHNAVIIGRSGAGKSFLVKAEVLRSLYRGVQAWIIDPEQEYTPLADAVGGTVIRLGDPGVYLNPLDLPTVVGPDGHRRAPGDALVRAALFVHTVVGVLLGEPTSTERAVLDAGIRASYSRAGIDEHDPRTWGRPAPLLADLAATLATIGAAGPELAERLAPFTSGAYAGLFAGPTTTPPEGQHLVTVSLRAVPDELRAVATLLTLETIWRQVSDPSAVRPRLVVVDEAWTLLQSPAGARFLARLARTARKRWAGLTVATQDAPDVLASELGRAVITNAATQILLRQSTQAIDEVAAMFGLSGGEREFLLRAEQGQGLLIAGSHRVALQVTASGREYEVITSDPRETVPDDAGYVDLTDQHTQQRAARRNDWHVARHEAGHHAGRPWDAAGMDAAGMDADTVELPMVTP